MSENNTPVRFEKIDSDNWYHFFKLPDEIIDYFWEQIEVAKKENESMKGELVGNISRSLYLKDPENLIIDKIFAALFNTQYQSYFTDVVRKYFRRITPQHTSLNAEPVLDKLWVNFQKKYEFNPLHDHSGLFSFVIWMKIPYNLEDERNLDFVKDASTQSNVGNFTFMSNLMESFVIEMDKDVEGCCVFFPAYLHHMVYPFYTSDEDRITISGNIFFKEVKGAVSNR
jgi:hypothetical protein